MFTMFSAYSASHHVEILASSLASRFAVAYIVLINGVCYLNSQILNPTIACILDLDGYEFMLLHVG